MLGYVIAKPRRRGGPGEGNLPVPADLRRRLKPWVDVDEVGLEGFWVWLRAVVPLLPHPEPRARATSVALATPREMMRQLEQRLALYAREQSRLTVVCDRAIRDNEVLVRRLKALEAALRTVDLAGHRVTIPTDPDALDAAERYSPTYPSSAGRTNRSR